MFDAKALNDIVTSNPLTYRENAISFIFNCPRCGKKDKLYIHKTKGCFVCFVCKETENFKGRAEYALRELYGLNLKDLRAKLYGGDISEQLNHQLILDFDDIWGESNELVMEELEAVAPALCWPPNFVSFNSPAFKKGLDYLYKRGIGPELIQKYDIRYSPEEKRVMFPVVVDGKLIGWQGRYISATVEVNTETGRQHQIPKILTSESLSGFGGRFLMFQDNLIGASHCTLAEGPISALKLEKCGGNVASMGKAVTQKQLEIICRHINKLYLALDPDAADEIVRIVCDTMENGIDCYLLEPPRGAGDVGDATSEENYEQFKSAPRLNRGTLMISLGSSLIF